MANYNYNENELVLLNDKLVANSMSDSTTTKYGVPTIPSQKLFKESYDKLSSDDKSISDFIEDVISADLYRLSGQYEGTKTDVEISCNAISNLIGSISTDLSNAITSDVKHLDDLQISAVLISSKINELCSEISTDLSTKYSWLSGEANRLCTELSDNVDSKFVHKTGDNINWLSVANGLSTTSFKSFIPGKDIPNKQFTEVVVDENGFKVDAIGQGRQIVLSTNNSTNDIIVNGSSLSNHIKNEVRISADEAIRLANTYTDALIQELVFEDTIADHEFVVGVNEENGKIAVARRKLLSTDIPTISETLVSNLTEDLLNLSSNYVKVSDFKTTLIDNDGKLLSAEDFDLTYDSTTHDIILKAGEKTYKFSAIEFIKSKTVDRMSIETDSEGNKWLLIYWTANDFIRLNINELVQVYNFENGISSQILPAGGIHVGATTDLARTTYANAISSYADAISTLLQIEIGRATTAEANLLSKIEAETSRAEGAERTNTTAISNEKSRAEEREGELQIAITAELTRAEEAEASLLSKIEAETYRATAAEGANVTAINTEKDRAVEKETDLQKAIDSEIERSKEEEVELKNTIDSETARATAAESANATAISTEEGRAKEVEGSLQAQINSVSTDLTAEVKARENADSEITINVNTVSSDVISLKTYATELSGSSPDNIGIIATLSNDISSLLIDAIKELKFDGHITIYSDLTAKTIPELFKQLNLGYDTNYVKNGSVYDITFDGIPTSCSYDLDVMKLGDGNYFIVHDHENKPFVKINDLNAENCYLIKAGVSRYVFETAYNWLSDLTDHLCSEISNDIIDKYSWLSGETDRLCTDISNDLTAKYSWLSGETDRLCTEISNDLITKYEKLTADDSFILSDVNQLCTEISNDLTAKYSWLSGETDRLCSEISNDVVAKYEKLSNEIITVSNDIDGTGIYNQLSVIKINKDEFDELVATDNTILSGNTLYIVDSDYIDAYGQVLCNLVMTDDNVPTDAANKHYVDEKDNALATNIKSVSSSVEVIKSKFNADTIATDPVLTKLLDDKNDSDISTVISAVMYIYNTLTQV